MSPMTEHLLVHDDNGVRTITWNRPEAKNAMTIEMWDGTAHALRTAASEGVRAIVLTGIETTFNVGQDLGEFADPRHQDPTRGFRGLMSALVDCEVPLIAAVNGLGVGFGMTVIPWCDFAYMSETARLRAPFVSLGVTTEAAASVALADVMGIRWATHYLVTGEWLLAEDAAKHGLVHEVVPHDQVYKVARERAEQLASSPPNSLRETLRLTRMHRGSRWEDAIEREYEVMAELAGSEENIAAITAFFESRK